MLLSSKTSHLIEVKKLKDSKFIGWSTDQMATTSTSHSTNRWFYQLYFQIVKSLKKEGRNKSSLMERWHKNAFFAPLAHCLESYQFNRFISQSLLTNFYVDWRKACIIVEWLVASILFHLHSRINLHTCLHVSCSCVLSDPYMLFKEQVYEKFPSFYFSSSWTSEHEWFSSMAASSDPKEWPLWGY